MSRGTVAGRVTLLTTGVAVVAVLIAGLLSYGLVRRSAEAEGQRSLAKQADLLVDVSLRDGAIRTTPRLLNALRAQGIAIARVTPRGEVRATGDLVTRIVTPYAGDLVAARTVSAVARADGEAWFVEGRPAAAGGAVVLVQRQEDSRAFGREVLTRTLLALAAGLLVAAAAGGWLARRFSRPLRRTALVAHQLAAGARQVRVPVDGPAEVADVAASVNTLAAALETSEGRQRQFLLSVSHELRTPLTGIKGFAESLADGVVTGTDTPAAGATILAEANRLERLIQDLLDLSRLGAQDVRIDVSTVDLADLVRAAAEVWQARCAAEGVLFDIELPDQPVLLHTDPTRVRQILDGLAENALRVTPAGRPIVLAARDEGTWAVLELRDGGPGLTPDDCAVAFDRSVLYERYRGVRQVGTGVGLALVRGLVTRLGGRAAAGRAQEGGARFTVWLPAGAPGDPAVTQPLPRAEGVGSPGGPPSG